MNTRTPDIEQAKAALRKEFGPNGWSIIHTRDTGRWWATRGPLTREDLNRTSDIDAATPEDLAEQIRAVNRAR